MPAHRSPALVDFDALSLPLLGEMTPKDTRQIRSSKIGVGFETLDRFMFDPDKVYPYVARLGAKWARVQTGWSRCETARGVLDFAWLDDVVDHLLDAGVQPFFSVTYGNALYMPEVKHPSAVGCVPLYFGPEARDAWVRFVTALAKHFAGRVGYWEIWNEPNITPFWYPQAPSPKDYVELVRLTSGPIRAAIPDAKIIGVSTCGLAPWFTEEALAAGLADLIDVAAFHPYQAVPEDNLQTMHDGFRRLLGKYARGKSIPVWQGECGCPSTPDSHEVFRVYDIDETVQAKWAARRVLADLKVGFERSFYYHLTDLMAAPYRQSDGRAGKPNLMGLLRGPAYEPKPAFEVFRRVCTLFDDDSVRQDLFHQFFHVEPTTPRESGMLASVTGATFVRHGSPLLAYWMSEDPQQRRAPGELELALFWDLDHRFDTPVLLDLMTGRYYNPAGVAQPFKGGGRFRLPVADYPLVLTDASVLRPDGTPASAPTPVSRSLGEPSRH